jgi:hypothetical protein
VTGRGATDKWSFPDSLRTGGRNARPENRFALYFCMVMLVEPVSGGLAESVAVTVMV